MQLPSENSLAAFEYAVAQGCDGFEFDVRTSHDGRLVCWHDPTIHGREIRGTSYSALGSAAGAQLPCLEDVLEQFAARAYLDIELKVSGAESSVLAALRKFPPTRGHVLSSFLPEVLLRLHELDPALPLGYLCEHAAHAPAWRELPVSVFIPQYKLATPELVHEVHTRGLKLFTWTVNSGPDLLHLARWGVDGLISDDPGLLARTFGADGASRDD